MSIFIYFFFFFFFFNDTATTEIYTLSLHDALPIYVVVGVVRVGRLVQLGGARRDDVGRSEEHTSELQSRENLVCRLLLEKKKKKKNRPLHMLSSNRAKQPATSRTLSPSDLSKGHLI